MVTPADPNELRRLESEAHEFERKSDYLGALDVYDEIVSKGWATARHLVARGYCYMKDRQRQQAKKDWLDGLALDPDNKLCREALDKFFPGWESKKEPPRLLRDKEMAPPPPPPSSFGQEITVETTSTATSQARNERPAPAVSAPQAPRPVGRPSQPAPRPQPAPARPQSAPARADATDSPESRVNWNFVLQDAAEEAAYVKRR